MKGALLIIGIATTAACASRVTGDVLDAIADVDLPHSDDGVAGGDNPTDDDQSTTDDAPTDQDQGADYDTTLPAAVIEAGFTINTFSTSSFTTENFDATDSKASGFDWYVWDLYGHADKSKLVINSDGSLTMQGDTTGPNGEIVSAVATGDGNWVGTAFGGGAYFEAVFAFDPQDVVATNYVGWPSWWSIPLDRVMLTENTWWNSDPSENYDHHIELDFMEYDLPGDLDRYGATIHDWYGIEATTCTSPPFCDWHTPYDKNLCLTPTNTNFKEYHAYGMLWRPATDSTQGSATYYFDRQRIGGESTWDKWINVPPPSSPAPDSPQPSWALAWTDKMQFILILGTGVNQPMSVKEVNVWQASAAQNAHR